VATTGRPRGLRVRTRCTTEDEFIALYQRDCDDSSLFAATDKELAVGADIAFSLELADGRPMLRGLGVVTHAWSTPQNRFRRTGVHIMFTQLTSASEPIHTRLMELRSLVEAQPRQRGPSNTQVRFGVIPTPPALAKWPDEESVVGDVRRSITREFEAVEPSTGAPVTVVEGGANSTVRYEGPLRAPARASTPIPQAARAEAVPLLDQKLLLPIPPPPRTAPAAATRPTEPLIATGVAANPVEPQRTRTYAFRWLADQLSRARAKLTPAYRWTARQLSPVGRRLAPAYRVVARRVEPIRRTRVYRVTSTQTQSAYRWLAVRTGSAYRRLVAWLRPQVRAFWYSRARTPVVFAAGIVVGVIVSAALRTTPRPVAVAKTEHPAMPIVLAQCPPAEPAIAAAPVPPTTQAAAPAKPARVATKKKQTPVVKRAVTAVATKTPAATKMPATTQAATKTPAPTPVATKKPATAATKQPVTAAMANTPATAKPAATTTKPAATVRKPATTTTTPKPTVTKAAARKGGCNSLDCI
jgi:hypothetical protein